ncbi:hypothetical protein C6361_35460 [Plantactinospora sp. BC1]|nr:hypothetical protein C6361_35460 [Plantactinospora sp. BC1]
MVHRAGRADSRKSDLAVRTRTRVVRVTRRNWPGHAATPPRRPRRHAATPPRRRADPAAVPAAPAVRPPVSPVAVPVRRRP